MAGVSDQAVRRGEVAQRLAQVRERIAGAARSAGRAVDEVTLTVVTKYFPATDVALLAELGVTDVGENRHQEAEAKAAEVVDAPLTWHFIGGLQSNKAAAVARWAHVVESVDRPKLVDALARGAAAHEVDLEVLIQVSLDDGPTGARAGVPPDEALALADRVAAADRLTLCGVMAVAPLGGDPRPAFDRLAEVSDRVRTNHLEATRISAGMSGDYEAAIDRGATHVRLGSAILGERPLIK